MERQDDPRWQALLDRLAEQARPAFFREELPFLKERYGESPEEVAWAYVTILGDLFLLTTGLVTAMGLPPEQAPAALAEIEGAVGDLDFVQGREALDPEEQRYYRVFQEIAARMLPRTATAMHAVLARYLSADLDLDGDPDLLIEEALALGERAGDQPALERARDLITRAGALVLAGRPHWHRWMEEAEGALAPWVRDVLLVAESLAGGEGLAPPDEAREKFQEEFREAAPAAQEQARSEPTVPDREAAEEDDWGSEVVEELIAVGGGQLPAGLIDRCRQHAEAAIPALIDVVLDDDLVADDAPGEGYAPIHAVELLGHLRAAEAVPLLIDLAADTDPLYVIYSSALHALEQIGAPAQEDLLRFMRFSRDNEAKAGLAITLARASRGDEAVYESLVTLFQQATWEEGRALVAGALAEQGDPRAIPLLQDVLQDPELSGLDRAEVLCALEDLGVEVPESAWEDEDRSFRLDAPDIVADLVQNLPERWQEHPDRMAHYIADAFIDSLLESALPFALDADIALEERLDTLHNFIERACLTSFDADLSAYSPKVRAVYEHMAECAGPDAQRSLQGIETVVQTYLEEAYDVEADPDDLVARAGEIVARNEAEARHLVGQAGAIALRGGDLWPRWPRETALPLSSWLWGLKRTIDLLKSAGNYPLPATPPLEISWERLITGEEEEREGYPPAVQRLIDKLFVLPQGTHRPDPATLSRFDQLRHQAIPALVDLVGDRSTWIVDEEGWGGWAPIVAIHLLGYLRANQATDLLVDIVAETGWDNVIHEAARLALLEIGRPAYPAVSRYLRYGRDVGTKVALAGVLARCGRSEAETFSLLAGLWQETAWSEYRRLVAVALGELGDRRALPLLREALDATESDFVDQLYLRWALQQLGEPVEADPSARHFYGRFSGKPRIDMPTLWPPTLVQDEETEQLARPRFNVWGERLCPDCGARMAWVGEEEEWVHLPDAPAPGRDRPPKGGGSKRKAKGGSKRKGKDKSRRRRRSGSRRKKRRKP